MLCIFAAAFLLLMVILEVAAAPSTVRGFVYNGFLDSDLLLHGAAGIESNGLLRLTNATKQELGHAFHPIPFRFLDGFSGQPLSFSTSFVFAIVSQYGETSSEGFAFAITPTVNLPGVLPSQFLGLFNVTSNGEAGCHILAVELDTVENKEFSDINDNHVGIDVNGLRSLLAAPASFVVNSSGSEPTIHNLSLISRNPMRIWAEYDATTMRFDVTLAPVDVPKPRFPLVSSVINLSSVFLSEMYVGFSASTGAIPASHNILGWSFSMNGREADLVISDLPTFQTVENGCKRSYTGLILILVLVSLTLVVALAFVLLWLVLEKWRKSADVSEEWETEYGPHRFSYSSLSKATKGFSDDNLLGSGGFGKVFKGQLPRSKQLVAVKRISHDSRQGKKEFVAEISSIGRLRHKNLVQLLGYGRRRGKLLLVYDFMPNGSLDEYIFCRPKDPLSWDRRFRIIKGIASGLLYLHEEWEQVVLHRDIKASNVLLDAEYNGKLGDFGLARLHDRGSNALTTRIVGTLGYLAPELSRTGKSTTSSDVFAFGAFLLEVACGKRPVELKVAGVEMVLVDWVLECWAGGQLLDARDRKLGAEFVADEVELVLRLGLMCSQSPPASRPTMRQLVQFLEGEAPLPEMTVDDLSLFHITSLAKGLLVANPPPVSELSATHLMSESRTPRQRLPRGR